MNEGRNEERKEGKKEGREGGREGGKERGREGGRKELFLSVLKSLSQRLSPPGSINGKPQHRAQMSLIQ